MLLSAEARAAAFVLAWFSLGCDVGTDYAATEADTGASPDSAGGSGSAAPTSVPSTLLPTLFGTPEQVGSGSSSDRWYKTDVERDGSSYFFMANGWGPGFEEQTVSWSGTAFTVESMQGMRGAGYEPATYPTVFCGQYSDSTSGSCGLPRALDGMQSLRTGWRWDANGNAGQYNAAYDVWLSTTGDISGHSAFLMVWLRDPKGQQPAGSKRVSGITVANAPGTWNVWAGNVNGKPCISYVRAEGQDSPEIELDVLDFVRDAATRNLSLPGSTVLSVAVGFEIWSGPVQELRSQDFYVRVD
jgi:hypothetical protein